MNWFIEKNHEECSDERPWAVVKADDGAVEGCHETREDATNQLRALLQSQAEQREEENEERTENGDESAAIVTAAVGDDMAENPDMKLVEGVAVTEGVWTGDGRKFAEDSLTWEDLDTVVSHFQWQKESSHGGINDVTVSVGRITKLERVDNEIRVSAFVDTGSDDGAEVARRLQNGTLGGVSIVADDPEQAEIELVYPEGCEELQDKTPEELDEVPIEELEACMFPSGVILHSGRIRALTLVDIPAFVTGAVELAEEEDEDGGDGVPVDVIDSSGNSASVKSEEFGTVNTSTPDGERRLIELDPDGVKSLAQLIDELEPLLAAAHHIVIDDLPPAEWFDEPKALPPFGAITVTDEGRVYGLLAPRDVAHRSFNGKRVTVPTGNVDYSRWMNRETIVDGGNRIATGVITMDCGHAPTSAGVDAKAGLDHYDNACSAVATARIGENKHGVWIAGALLPGVAPDRVARMLACALSGDWRPHREKPGMRELVGALLVPVPGFPTESSANLKLDQGELVASTVPVRRASRECVSCGDSALTAAVIGSTDLPIADRDTEWDGSGALGRVFDLCTDDDSVDVDCVSRAFLWRDTDQDAETRGAYSLGFADVINDTLQIVPAGVAAAAGGRGVDAADIPDEDKDRIKARICTLYDAIRDEFDDWPACPFADDGDGDGDDESASTSDTEALNAAETVFTDSGNDVNNTDTGIDGIDSIPTWDEVQRRRELKSQTEAIVAQMKSEFGIEIEV